jgi:putative transposase
MPRRSISFTGSSYYHIYNRGINSSSVFFQSSNYIFFLQKIKRYILPEAIVVAYCLMPTHYHLLVRIKDHNSSFEFSKAMQQLVDSYTKSVNKSNHRTGPLFEGQFKAKIIESGEHLRMAVLYIHSNPVKDGLVSTLEDWPYSNYLEWIGLRNGTLVDREYLEYNFRTGMEYKDCLMEYITECSWKGMFE